MFVLNSDVTIGKFRFTGAHEIIINRTIHSITETATIVLPSIARIVRNGKASTETIITGNQFTEGDAVTIRMGYNGQMQTEFSGFVKSRDLQMPLVIECEGYSWLLRRNKINTFCSSITIRDLLQLAISGIDSRFKIDVQCTSDITLNNVQVGNKTGFEVFNDIEKYTDGAVKCFFIRPGVI